MFLLLLDKKNKKWFDLSNIVSTVCRVIGKRHWQVVWSVIYERGEGHGHVILPRFTDSLVPVVPLSAPPSLTPCFLSLWLSVSLYFYFMFLSPPSSLLFAILNHPFQLLYIIVFSRIKTLTLSTRSLSKTMVNQMCTYKTVEIVPWLTQRLY